jgi:polysaccharide biosynthesis protein PslH
MPVDEPRTLFVTAGPPLPADRGARVRDLALITRTAASRPVSLLALVGSAVERAGLEPMRESLPAVEIAVVPERPRAPVRLRPDGPRAPLASVPFLDAAAVESFRAMVERERPAVVQLEHWFLAPLIDALPAADRPAMVISLHNVASAQYGAQARSAKPAAALGYRAKSRLAAGVERRFLPRFDAVVCVSERERDLLASVAPGSTVEVVPNGVDTAAMPLLAEEGAPGRVLLVANLEYRPNLEAAEWLCRRVLPELSRNHPAATIRLVGPGGGGRVASLERLPGVEVAGAVVDLIPEYRTAQVAVAPLLSGGGTRLKILEAMALGRPVVATSIGCEGLGLSTGEQLLVADDPAGFAGAIGHLLGSASDRKALAASARARVERDHDWDRSAAALRAVHDRAVAHRRDQGRKRLAATA